MKKSIISATIALITIISAINFFSKSTTVYYAEDNTTHVVWVVESTMFYKKYTKGVILKENKNQKVSVKYYRNF